LTPRSEAAPSAQPALAAPAKPATAPPTLPLRVAARGGQRDIDLGSDPAAAVRAARRAPGTLDAQQAADRMLILSVRKAAVDHDFAALKLLMSERLAGAIEPMLDKQGERFWKHVGRYAEAAEHGFTTSDEAGDGSGLRRMIVKLPSGEELKPILQKTPDGWKFDRF